MYILNMYSFLLFKNLYSAHLNLLREAPSVVTAKQLRLTQLIKTKAGRSILGVVQMETNGLLDPEQLAISMIAPLCTRSKEHNGRLHAGHTLGNRRRLV